MFLTYKQNGLHLGAVDRTYFHLAQRARPHLHRVLRPLHQSLYASTTYFQSPPRRV